MTAKRFYLIVNAAGQARVLTRYWPNLKADEVGFRVVVNIPTAWGQIAKGELTIDMPEPPTIEGTVDGVKTPADQAREAAKAAAWQPEAS